MLQLKQMTIMFVHIRQLWYSQWDAKHIGKKIVVVASLATGSWNENCSTQNHGITISTLIAEPPRPKLW